MVYCTIRFVLGYIVFVCSGIWITSGQYWEMRNQNLHSPDREEKSQYIPKPSPQPQFVIVRTNITTEIGESAYLPCQVNHLGDKTVSWMRQRDLHILTSGSHVYTSDGRFEILHPLESDSWTLRLRDVQKRDAGVYECQVNTDPKIKQIVYLNISDADMLDSPYKSHNFLSSRDASQGESKIIGEKKQEVKSGTTVIFECLVRYKAGPQSHQSVTWYHNNEKVSLLSSRSGFNLQTERIDDETTSKLVLTHVTSHDEGIYTCVPEYAQPASVILRVFPGEYTAGAIKGAESASIASLSSWKHLHLTQQCCLFLCVCVSSALQLFFIVTL